MKKFLPYLKLLKAVRTEFILALLFAVLYGVSRGFGIPFMMQKIFPKIFDAQTDKIGLWLLAGYCLLPVIIVSVQGISIFFNNYLVNVCGKHVMKCLRVSYFEKLQLLPISFFHKTSAGELLSRGMNDTLILQNTINTVALEIFRQPTTLAGAIGYLLYLCFYKADIFFLLLFILAAPVCIIPIRYVNQKLKKKAMESQQQIAHVMQGICQNLSMVREIRSFSMENKELKKFKDSCEQYRIKSLKVDKYSAVLSPIIELIAATGIGLSLFYAYLQQIHFEILFATIIALYLCYEPIKKLGELNNRIAEGTVSLERIEEVLKEPIILKESIHPISVKQLKGDIVFENIDFSYEKQLVLRNISVSLHRGTTYALVGPSGAGKSTFANLILRFYDPQKGRITIDGIDIKEMRFVDLRSHIAMVSQEPALFNDTLFNNLRIGNLSASKEEVIEAAHKAYAHEFIEKLDNGYDTLTGASGVQLSGGEKQRIAIARAFLKNSPILILDEATSALDANSEHLIGMALQKLMQKKTVIIISHRFSLLSYIQQILVFQEGQVIGQGTHHELVAQNTLYKSLYLKQKV